MRRFLLVVPPLLLIVLSTGCPIPQTPRDVPITGGGPGPSNSQSADGDGTETADGDEMNDPPPPCVDEPIFIRSQEGAQTVSTAALGVKVTVEWLDADRRVRQKFDALWGSRSGGTVQADGGITLDTGWLLLDGEWPYVRAGRVSAGADGSRLVVRRLLDSFQIFFRGGTRAFVIKEDGAEISWTSRDTFVLINPLGEPELKSLAADSDAAAFLEQVDQLAACAGI